MEDWSAVDVMIQRLDPASGDEDIPLATFAGKMEDAGRLNLSTLHSAKGREWDVAILLAMDNDVIPNGYENTASKQREARRQFYVGVTRPRKALHIVFSKGHHSPFVAEVYRRLQEGG